jgi:hypothetical protein
LLTAARCGGSESEGVKVQYTRSAGRHNTYFIAADARGEYKVWFGEKLLLSGKDRLTACGGKAGRPSRLKEAGAVAAAKVAIERLHAMEEE